MKKIMLVLSCLSLLLFAGCGVDDTSEPIPPESNGLEVAPGLVADFDQGKFLIESGGKNLDVKWYKLSVVGYQLSSLNVSYPFWVEAKQNFDELEVWSFGEVSATRSYSPSAKQRYAPSGVTVTSGAAVIVTSNAAAPQLVTDFGYKGFRLVAQVSPSGDYENLEIEFSKSAGGVANLMKEVTYPALPYLIEAGNSSGYDTVSVKTFKFNSDGTRLYSPATVRKFKLPTSSSSDTDLPANAVKDTANAVAFVLSGNQLTIYCNLSKVDGSTASPFIMGSMDNWATKQALELIPGTNWAKITLTVTDTQTINFVFGGDKNLPNWANVTSSDFWKVIGVDKYLSVKVQGTTVVKG